MNKNVDTTPRTGNDKQTGQFGNHKARTIAKKGETIGNQEKMLLYKKEAKGIPLSADKSEWLQDTGDEPDEKRLEAHYMYMEKIHEVLHATYDNSRPIYDTEQLEKNAEEPKDERVLHAFLIGNLKLDVDENKKIQKQLKKENMSLTQELDKSNRALKDCNIELS
nr:hypothetical protein [Tanacetum cinerariifolium]